MENGWEWTGEWCERVGVGCGNGVVMEVGKGPDCGGKVGLLVGKYVDWRQGKRIKFPKEKIDNRCSSQP